MVRSLRIEYEGAWYHVMNRGLEYRDIFLNNKHRKLFLELLSELSWRFKVDVHCYCLMDNHYHLLLQSELPNLSSAMKFLNGVYTLKFNRDVKRDGPLFRGRYKSVLIDKDEYFLNVSRYIHKNPSAAKIIDDDKKYRWSSYRYYCLDKDKKPEWLITDEILKYFNGDGIQYCNFADDLVDENTRKFYQSQKMKPIIGSKVFNEEISDKFFKNVNDSKSLKGSQLLFIEYPSLEEIMQKVLLRYRIKSDFILKNNSRESIFERNLLIYLFMLNPRYKALEKAKFLGVSSDAISKSYKRFLRKIDLDSNMREEVENVRVEIYGS